MPRPSNTETRRTQIVRAMSAVMAEQGYDGATVQAVAAKAGLTPGLVHYHFKSKLAILLSLIEHLEKTVLLRYEALKKRKDPQKDLKAFIDAYLALGESADQVSVRCWIYIGAEALRQTDVDAAYKSVMARQIEDLEKLVKRCLKDEAKTTKSSRAIALGIHAAIEGSLRLLVSAPSLIEPGFAAPTVFAMAKGAIAIQPKA